MGGCEGDTGIVAGWWGGIGTIVMGINGLIRVQYTHIHLLSARPIGIVIAQAKQ